MNRTELLASYLEVLDDINESTRLALETLNKNAETTRMVIDELINGCVDYPEFAKPDLSLLKALKETDDISYIDEGDDLEAVADKIVKQIMENGHDQEGVYGLSVVLDPTKHDPEEVMELVKKKLDQANAKEEEKKEAVPDDFDFDNPLA